MRKKIKVLALIMSLIMAAALFTGCKGGNTSTNIEDSQEKSKKTASNTKASELVIASPIDGDFDVQLATVVHPSLGLIYEPLITLDKERKNYIPHNVESVSISDDGKTITFKIPEGLTFTNGDPFNAEAVKASFERLLKKSKMTSFYSAVSKIEAPDSKTVVITCSSPSGILLTMLTSGLSGIVNAAEAEKVGDQAFLSNPVGYGPYYLKELNKGNYAILARNDKYKTNDPNVQNKGPYNFETIKYRYITNSFTIINELIAGNVDAVLPVPTENLQTLKNYKDISILEGKGLQTSYIVVNSDKISDIKVRAALGYAINREDLKKALQNTVEPLYGPYSPGWVGFSKEAEEQYKKDYAFNLEKSKALLAEVGYKDTNGDGIVEKNGKPLELNLLINSGVTQIKTIGPILQMQYSQLGVKINIKEGDTSTLNQAIITGEYDLMFSRTSFNDAAAMEYISNLFSLMKSSSDKDKFNKLNLEAKNTINVSERTDKYAEAGKLLIKNSTIINLCSSNIYMAFRNNVKGIKYSENGTLYLNDATKE